MSPNAEFWQPVCPEIFDILVSKFNNIKSYIVLWYFIYNIL